VIPAAVVEEHLQRVEAEESATPEPRRRILPLLVLILLIVAIIVLAAWGLSR